MSKSQKIVKVKFSDHVDGLRGGSSELSKICFLSKYYKGTRPQAGETWECRVVYDSQPTDDDKGCVFVWPERKSGDQPKGQRYEGGNLFGEDKITVVRLDLDRGRIIGGEI